MKGKQNLKIIILITFLVVVFFSFCKKESELPHISPTALKVYKTKGDYFKYANTWGTYSGPTVLSNDNNRISIIGNDTIYKLRWKLDSNYALGVEIWYYDYFTDITYPEIVAYNESHPECFPLDLLFKRVIDYDPFIEFYVDVDKNFYYQDSTNIQKINQIIKDGEIEKYFKRIK